MDVTTSVVCGRLNEDGTERIRLKCIVLGAAGAGKTSILRRYFSDTFHTNRIGYANRIPTSGADYYTGRVRNPLWATTR